MSTQQATRNEVANPEANPDANTTSSTKPPKVTMDNSHEDSSNDSSRLVPFLTETVIIAGHRVRAIREAIDVCLGNPSKIPSSMTNASKLAFGADMTDYVIWAALLWALWFALYFIRGLTLEVFDLFCTVFEAIGRPLIRGTRMVAVLCYIGAHVVSIIWCIITNILGPISLFINVLLLTRHLASKYRPSKPSNLSGHSHSSESSSKTPIETPTKPKTPLKHHAKPPNAGYAPVSPKIKLYTEANPDPNRPKNLGVIEWRNGEPAPGQFCAQPAENCHHNKELANYLLHQDLEIYENLRKRYHEVTLHHNFLERENKRLESEQDGLQRKVAALEKELTTTREALELSDELAGPESQALYDKQKQEIEAKSQEANAIREAAEQRCQALKSKYEELSKHTRAITAEAEQTEEKQNQVIIKLTRGLMRAESELHQVPSWQAQLKDYKDRLREAQRAQSHAETRFRNADERRQSYYDRLTTSQEDVRRLATLCSQVYNLEDSSWRRDEQSSN